MNKELLIKSIQELPDLYDINLKIVNEDIVITLVKRVDEFEQYIKELDDDTFAKACSVFDSISDISLSEFILIIDSEEGNKYKELFKKIVDFINAN